MNNISIYLEKFKDFGFEEKGFKNGISKVFKKYQIEVDPKNIKINNGVVDIYLSGAEKSEFILNKKKIEEEIFNNISRGKIGKIR